MREQLGRISPAPTHHDQDRSAGLAPRQRRDQQVGEVALIFLGRQVGAQAQPEPGKHSVGGADGDDDDRVGWVEAEQVWHSGNEVTRVVESDVSTRRCRHAATFAPWSDWSVRPARALWTTRPMLATAADEVNIGRKRRRGVHCF
jgi:hypothetical protein